MKWAKACKVTSCLSIATEAKAAAWASAQQADEEFPHITHA